MANTSATIATLKSLILQAETRLAQNLDFIEIKALSKALAEIEAASLRNVETLRHAPVSAEEPSRTYPPEEIKVDPIVSFGPR